MSEEASAVETPEPEVVATELERRAPVNSLAAAEEMFPVEARQAIAQFLTIPPEDPALIPYLAICAKWDLDPVAGQIWLIEQKIKGRNGTPDRWVKKPAVGRDGFLAIARRSPEFEGMDFDTVYSGDDFWVERNGNDHVVHHTYKMIPNEFEQNEDPRGYRGTLIGAYCKVYLKGRRPVFYFAPLKEHAQTGTDQSGRGYYQGAWKYTSTMIIKSAQSVALRLAFGITGVIPTDEMSQADRESGGKGEGREVIESVPMEDVILELGFGEEITRELTEEVIAVNAEAPNSWGAAKLKMRLTGKPEEDAQLVLNEIRRERELRAERLAREEEAAEEAVQDAQVVQTIDELRAGHWLEYEGEWREVRDIVDDTSAKLVVVFFEDHKEVGIEPGAEIVFSETQPDVPEAEEAPADDADSSEE